MSSMYIAPKVEAPPISDDPDADMMNRMKGSYNILAVGKDKVGLNTDTIMVHVRNIREKIEINPKEPRYLKVVWGVGYKIEKQ